MKSRVEEINSLASRIQNLNSQIFEAEMYGDQASNFRDERDSCCMENRMQKTRVSRFELYLSTYGASANGGVLFAYVGAGKNQRSVCVG